MFVHFKYTFFTILFFNFFTNTTFGASSQILLNSFPTDGDDLVYQTRADEYLQEYNSIKRERFPEEKKQRLYTVCVEGPIYLFLAQRHTELHTWLQELKSKRTTPSYISNGLYNLYLVQALYFWMGEDHEVKKLQTTLQRISQGKKDTITGFFGYLKETDQNIITPFKNRKKQEADQAYAELLAKEKKGQCVVSEATKKKKEKKPATSLQTTSNSNEPQDTPFAVHSEPSIKIDTQPDPAEEINQIHEPQLDDTSSQVTFSEVPIILSELELLQQTLADPEKRSCEDLLRAVVLYKKEDTLKKQKKIPKFLKEAIEKRNSLTIEERENLLSKIQAFAIEKEITSPVFDDIFRTSFMVEDQIQETPGYDSDVTEDRSVISVSTKAEPALINSNPSSFLMSETPIPKSNKQIKNKSFWRGFREAQKMMGGSINEAFQEGYYYKGQEIICYADNGFYKVLVGGFSYFLVYNNGQSGFWINSIFYPFSPYI